LIAELHRSGTTIFLTTHYIEEAERLCGRIAFIVEGRIVKIDTVDNLLQAVRGRHVMQVSVSKSSRMIYRTLKSSFPEFAIQPVSGDLIRIEAKQPISIGPLVRVAEEQGAEVTEARRIRPTLEEVFVEVTGIELDMMRKEKEKSGDNQ
jgi:ABC-2 type transport system ATP-binding protein